MSLESEALIAFCTSGLCVSIVVLLLLLLGILRSFHVEGCLQKGLLYILQLSKSKPVCVSVNNGSISGMLWCI